MLVLFDQGAPVGIARLLKQHTVETARERGWSTLKNGDLLRVAEEAGFDVLLTTDKNLAHQQNLSAHKIAIVVLGTTRRSVVQQMSEQIVSTLDAAKPGSYSIIDIS